MFTPEDGSNLVYVNETFPVEAKCFALYSQNPSGPEVAGYESPNEHGPDLHLNANEYWLTFTGCGRLTNPLLHNRSFNDFLKGFVTV